MKGKIEAIILRDFANIFKKLNIYDIQVEVQEDGWYVAAVDVNSVVLAEVLLRKDAWEEYEFTTKTFAIDTDRLYNWARDFKKGEIAEIVFSDTEKMEAAVQINGALTRTFKLFSLEAVRQPPKIPELEYKLKLTLLEPQIQTTKNVLKAAPKAERWEVPELHIGVVEQNREEYELCLYAVERINRECVPLERTANYTMIEAAASIYNVEYFKRIFALLTRDVVKTGTVTLQFAFQYPLRVSYEHKGIEVKQILLSPRVDPEEELTERGVLEDLMKTPEEVEIVSTDEFLVFIPTAKGKLPMPKKEISLFELINELDGLIEEGWDVEELFKILALKERLKEVSYDENGGIVKEEIVIEKDADLRLIIKIRDIKEQLHEESDEAYTKFSNCVNEKSRDDPECKKLGEIYELKSLPERMEYLYLHPDEIEPRGVFASYLKVLQDKFGINIKEFKDKLTGGRADAKDITKYDINQIAMGIEVEKEHTDDLMIALEITLDHLEEIPDYYSRLGKMELKALFEELVSDTYTGYRTEVLYGAGVRDLRAVVKYEVVELGNTDIIEYLKKKRVIKDADELDAAVDVLYSMGYTKAVWLSDTKADILESYPPSPGEKYTFDRYTIKKAIFISDLGKSGKLVVYKPVNITEEVEEIIITKLVIDAIKEAEKDYGSEVPERDIIEYIKEEITKEDVEDAIYRLKRDGIIYSPMKGVVSRVEGEREEIPSSEIDIEKEEIKAEIDRIIKKGENDVLLQYHFGGWGGKLFGLAGYLNILGEPDFPEEEREKAKRKIPPIFTWMKKKYDQIPFSELSKSPFYDDLKPLFEINKLLSALDEELKREPLDFDKINTIMSSIGERSTEYGKIVDKYYRELTGKDLGAENVETRALMEYRSKEQIEDQVRWLKEHDIEPNSFEMAAMDYYGVVGEREKIPLIEEELELPYYAHTKEELEKKREKEHDKFVFSYMAPEDIELLRDIFVKGEGLTGYDLESKIFDLYEGGTEELTRYIDIKSALYDKHSFDIIEAERKKHVFDVFFTPGFEISGVTYGRSVPNKDTHVKVYRKVPKEILDAWMPYLKELKQLYEDGRRETMKKAWNLTRDRYVEVAGPGAGSIKVREKQHKIEVQIAIDAGEDIPEKVLKDYPELVEKTELPDWIDELISAGGEILPDRTLWLYHATTKEIADVILKTGVLKTAPRAGKQYGIYAGSNPSVGFDYGDGTVVPIRVPVKDLDIDDFFEGRRVDFRIEATEYTPIEIGEVLNVREMPSEELVEKFPQTESWVTDFKLEIEEKIKKEIPEEDLKRVMLEAMEHLEDYYGADVLTDRVVNYVADKTGVKEIYIIRTIGKMADEGIIEAPKGLEWAVRRVKREVTFEIAPELEVHAKRAREYDTYAEYLESLNLPEYLYPDVLVNVFHDRDVVDVIGIIRSEMSYFEKIGRDWREWLRSFNTITVEDNRFCIYFSQRTTSPVVKRIVDKAKLRGFLWKPTNLCRTVKITEFNTLREFWEAAQKGKPPEELVEKFPQTEAQVRDFKAEIEEKILKESTENGWLYTKILDDKYAGSLEIWDMGKGEYKIENIDVAPTFRRRGVASDLIEEVTKDFVPYNKLKWGMQTEEGAKLKEALDIEYKVVKEEAKEPWEMTQSEYLHIWLPRSAEGISEKRWLRIIKNTENAHRNAVEQALKEGKPVPEEVLADYPELVEKEENEFKTIPEALTELAEEARQYETVEDWKRAVGRRPKTEAGLSQLNLVGGAVASHGFKGMHEFWRIAKATAPEKEVTEEKWENVTKEKLEDIRRTSKSSEKYAISQAKATKKVSATEEAVYEKLSYTLDLGPYSNVLLYTPVDEIRWLPKSEHAALIKLVDRGWFQVYKVPKPVSEKYASGFTYMLKKTKDEREEIEKAKAEIEEKIKPLISEVSEAENAITECDKGFETCLEFCNDDLEVCYEECAEAEDVPKCNKKCEEKREKCHNTCEDGADECYDDSAREIIEREIEEGNLTKAEEDLETFMDYISDGLYEELDKKIGRIKKEIEIPPEEEVIIPPLTREEQEEKCMLFYITKGLTGENVAEVCKLSVEEVEKYYKYLAERLPEHERTYDEIRKEAGITLIEKYGESEEVVADLLMELLEPPVEEVVPEKRELQKEIHEYFKTEIAETTVELYRRDFLEKMYYEIEKAFIGGNLIREDRHELLSLINKKREELIKEIEAAVVVTIPAKLEEKAAKEAEALAAKELLKERIHKKIQLYEREGEVPELKMGARVNMQGRIGVVVDVSAGKFRVNWEDGEWNWVRMKYGEIVIV